MKLEFRTHHSLTLPQGPSTSKIVGRGVGLRALGLIKGESLEESERVEVAWDYCGISSHSCKLLLSLQYATPYLCTA